MPSTVALNVGAIAIIVSLLICGASAQIDYHAPHNLVLEGQSFADTVSIYQPTGYVVIRDCSFKKTMKIFGNYTAVPKVPQELTMLLEQLVMSETIQIRYQNLFGNSSITVRDVELANAKADSNFRDMRLNGTPFLCENMVQTSFDFRYNEVFNGSTITVRNVTLPTTGTDTVTGHFHLQNVNIRGGSAIVYDGVKGSFLELETGSLISSRFALINSHIESDGLCVKSNCHFNVSDVIMNDASFTLENTALLNATFRLNGCNVGNKSVVNVSNSVIKGDEQSPFRTRSAITLASSTSIELGSTFALENSMISINPSRDDVKLNVARAIIIGASMRFSTLQIYRTAVWAKKGVSSTGAPLYANGPIVDCNIDIDKYSFDAMSPGNLQFRALSSLQHPFDVSNVNNAKLGVWLRGDIGHSVIATNATLKLIECESGSFTGSDRGIFITNSAITTIRLETNVEMFSGAAFVVSEVSCTTLLITKASFFSGASMQLTSITIGGAFTWLTGALTTATATMTNIMTTKLISLQTELTQRAAVTITNSSLMGGFEFTGTTIGKNSTLELSGNRIEAELVNKVSGLVAGIAVKSVMVRASGLIFRENAITVIRTNQNVPTPDDIAIGIYVEGTTQLFGSSTVQFLRNNVTAIQNGGKGLTIRHEAPGSGATTLDYGPPIPAPGSNLTEGKDVVELRLDKNATLVADWCAMWDVAKLALTFIDAARPLVLDGVDSTGIQQLNLDCGGGSGALPISIANSRFAGLAVTRCIVDDDSPFLVQDSNISGSLTWGQTSVAHAAAAVLFNTTIGGGIVNTVPAVRNPSEVDRPPELLKAFFAGIPMWNPRKCYPDAPPFSYTPSPTATGPTPTFSSSLSVSPTMSVPSTPSPTVSRSSLPTPSISAASTESSTVQSSGTETVQLTTTQSSVVSASSTFMPSMTPKATRTKTPIPPTRTDSRTITPVPIPTPTRSATISKLPCNLPPVNETKFTLTEDELRDGPVTLSLRVGQVAMFAAAVHATAAEPEIHLNASAFTVYWTRNGASVPSGLATSGTLPSGAATLTAIHSNSSYFRLRLDMRDLDEQALAFDEVYPTEVIVKLQPAFFAAVSCGYRAAAGLVLIEPATRSLLGAANALLQGVGDVAAVSSVIAGGGSAGDAISLAILADMSCARPVVKASGHNQRLLSPAAFDSSLPGMLYGSLLLVVLIPVLHVAATLGYAKRQGVSRARMIFAMAVTRFPSWTFGTLTVLHQGVTYVSLKLLFVEGPGEHGGGAAFAAVLGLLFAVVVPPAFVFVAARYITATYVRYDYEATPEEARPSACWQHVLPRGRWELREVRSAYGVMLSPFERPHPMWAAYMFASPSLVAIIAVPTPATTSGCAVQYAIMMFALTIYGLSVYWLRPFRSVIHDWLSLLSTAALGGIVTLLFLGELAGNVKLQPYTAAMLVCILALIVATIVRVVYVVGLLWIEVQVTAKTILRPFWLRSPEDVWMAFPCLGFISGSYARKRGRATVQQQRELNRLPETYEIPPPMVGCPPTDLESPLLQEDEEAVSEPVIHSKMHIIDVAALENADDLLHEKAVFDDDEDEETGENVDCSQSINQQANPVADDTAPVPSAVNGEGEAEPVKEEASMETKKERRTIDLYPPIPVLPGSKRGSTTEDAEKVAGSSWEAVRLEEGVSEAQKTSGDKLPDDENTERNLSTETATSANSDSIYGLLKKQPTPDEPKPHAVTMSDDAYTSATAGMSEFAYEATRKRSVTYTNLPAIEVSVEEEMKPRARSVPPENPPSREKESSSGSLGAPDASIEEMKFSWDKRANSLLIPSTSHSPNFVARTASPSIRGSHSADSKPSVRGSTDDTHLNDKETPKAPPAAVKKRVSIFDVPTFDPAKKARDPPADAPHGMGASVDLGEESSEWVVADRTAAQLLQVPAPTAPARPPPLAQAAAKKEPFAVRAHRRRSMSMDFAWSMSAEPEPAPVKSPLSAPKINPLMAGRNAASPIQEDRLAATARPYRGPGKASRPSIYSLLPGVQEPEKAERMRAKRRSFSTGPQERMARKLSFSL